MKDMNSISKEREQRIALSHYKNLIDTIAKIEYANFAKLGLIELSEVIGIANYTVYYVINNSDNTDHYNESYLAKAIKWAIRNEVRRRYKWYTTIKKNDNIDQEKIKDAVYKTILSIEEMAEAENPIFIKDTSGTPEEKTELLDLKNRICEIIKDLPEREQHLVKAKYFYDKRLKDISEEYHISQSRVSRIIQNALDKIKKELLKQEEFNENDI